MKAQKPVNGVITFKPLRETDIPLLHRWLNTLHVSEWWSLDGSHTPSYEEVEKHYLPRILRAEKVDGYIIEHERRPIGMIQAIKLDDFPEEKAMFGVGDRCAGIDLFIGEEDRVHRGLGASVICTFLKEFVFTQDGVDCCIIDPEPANRIAIRAYEKAGFTYMKTVRNAMENVEAYLMRLNRDECE